MFGLDPNIHSLIIAAFNQKGRFMKYFLLATLLAFAAPAQAGETMTAESEAMLATLASCYEPLSEGKSPTDVAIADHLRELPAEQAKLMAQKGGRVFVIRPASTLLLTFADSPACSVVMTRLNFEKFKKEVELAFGEDSPFKLVSQKAEGDSVTRQYAAQVGSDAYVLTISAEKKYQEGSVQGILTVGKVAPPKAN